MAYATADPRATFATPPTGAQTNGALRRPPPSLARAPHAERPVRAVSRLALLGRRPEGVGVVLTVAALLAELPGRGTLDIGAHLQGLCRDLAAAFGRPGGPRLGCSAAPRRLPMGQALTLGLIADLLVSDAYTYGFPPPAGGRIAVDLLGLEAVVELTIDDSGRVGRATDRRRADTLTIASLLARHAGGWLETPKVIAGTRCVVTLPRHNNRRSS